MSPARMTLTRAQLIAAEVFGYSFHHYEDHLGIGNLRYEQLMPESAMVLEQAVRESWPLAKVAAELKASEAGIRGICVRSRASSITRATSMRTTHEPPYGPR